MSPNKFYRICLFGFLSLIQTTQTVRITSLDVPKTAYGTITLNCRYDLEGDTLYGVKWYKDNVEFFRCLADGTVQEFPLKDIEIYTTGQSHIGACYFQLKILSNQSGGDYTCEVSLDWPTFKTVTANEHLRIIDPSTIKQARTDDGTTEQTGEPEINMYSFSTGSKHWGASICVLVSLNSILFYTVL